MNEENKKIEKTREGHFFFLECLARLAGGEATSFPSTCSRERWENGERTEISVTVTKGVAYEGGYANTFLLVWSTFFIIFSTSHSGRKE